MSKKIKTIRDLCPDDANANAGTERGAGMLEHSFRTFGAGRSVLADKNGKLIAGNKSVETAVSIGMDDVIVVQSDGTKLVVVQRTDLDLDTDAEARGLAISDNRTGEVNLNWDGDVLEQLGEAVDLSQFWFGEELHRVLDGKENGATATTSTGANLPNESKNLVPKDDRYKEQYGVIVICEDEGHQKDVYSKLQAQGHECRIVVT